MTILLPPKEWARLRPRKISTTEAIHLTPKTVLVRVDARKLWSKFLRRNFCSDVAGAAGMHPIAVHVQQTVTEQFVTVGDFWSVLSTMGLEDLRACNT